MAFSKVDSAIHNLCLGAPQGIYPEGQQAHLYALFFFGSINVPLKSNQQEHFGFVSTHFG